MPKECPICGVDSYTKKKGCDECGHYDEYYAKRKLKQPTHRRKRLDPRFR